MTIDPLAAFLMGVACGAVLTCVAWRAVFVNALREPPRDDGRSAGNVVHIKPGRERAHLQ